MRALLGAAIGLGLMTGCSAKGNGFSPGSDAGAADSGPDLSRKRVFVTATTYLGDLSVQVGADAGGPASADTLCRKAAEAAQLGGDWKAYLSDDSTDAVDRMADVGPWYSVDRKVLLFANKAAMSTQPNAPVALSEKGTSPPGGGQVWTGTSSAGHKSTGIGANCQNWTSRATSDQGTSGSSYGDPNLWQESMHWYCASEARLYCFEQ